MEKLFARDLPVNGFIFNLLKTVTSKWLIVLKGLFSYSLFQSDTYFL